MAASILTRNLLMCRFGRTQIRARTAENGSKVIGGIICALAIVAVSSSSQFAFAQGVGQDSYQKYLSAGKSVVSQAADSPITKAEKSRAESCRFTTISAEIAEERVRMAEERIRAAEEYMRAADERVRAAEERARAAEQRALVAEQRAKSAEYRAKSAEQRAWASADQRARAAEHQARVAEQRARDAEERAKIAEERARSAEERARAAVERSSNQAWRDRS